MPQEIVERIERELGIPGLAEMLATQLAPTDLQSLLLEVARRRAAATMPADILRRYATDRFVRPAASRLCAAAAIRGEGARRAVGRIRTDSALAHVSARHELIAQRDQSGLGGYHCPWRRDRQRSDERSRPRMCTTATARSDATRAAEHDPSSPPRPGLRPSVYPALRAARTVCRRPGRKRRGASGRARRRLPAIPRGASMSGPSPSTGHRGSPRTTAAPRSESRSQGRRSWREASSTGRKRCSETGRNDF